MRSLLENIPTTRLPSMTGAPPTWLSASIAAASSRERVEGSVNTSRVMMSATRNMEISLGGFVSMRRYAGLGWSVCSGIARVSARVAKVPTSVSEAKRDYATDVPLRFARIST